MSFYVALYPFIEQNARYQLVMAEGDESHSFNGWSKVWQCSSAEFQGLISGLGCPSDPVGNSESHINRAQRGSYSGSNGDATVSVGENGVNQRGFFPGGLGRSDLKNLKCNKMATMTDGTSNTLAIIETVCGKAAGTTDIKGGTVKFNGGSPISCLGTVSTTDRNVYNTTDVCANVHGEVHTDGRPGVLAVTTVLPPNSPSCRTDVTNPGWGWGYHSASSFHSGGVNGLRVDGSVAFYSDTIDCGDLSVSEYTSKDPSGKSPFGVWGALGTVAGSESTIN